MKIVSFNVNGIRSRLHHLRALVEKHRPHIIGLQETKVRDEEFPRQAIEDLGYGVTFHGQKTHYGVALMSRQEPLKVRLGFPWDGDETQKRFVSAVFELGSGETLTVINGYFPQGENRDHPVKFPEKRKFYDDMYRYLDEYCGPDAALVMMGDFNVAPLDADIGIGDHNAKRWLRTGKTCFLPEEREWFEKLLAWGLVDSFREFNPAIDDRFSWFDYRSRGFEYEPKRGLRIDHLLLTRKLLDVCRETGIDYELRAMDKPSDHCPVWVDVDIE
jgi:exodeoxyribonuclease-3